MANVPCFACESNHQGLQQRDVIRIVQEFQEGNAQVVTSTGIRSRCILEVIGLPPRQNNKHKGRPSYGTTMVPSVLHSRIASA
jgi:hypothetical protein